MHSAGKRRRPVAAGLSQRRDAMDDSLVTRIASQPKYQQLKTTRMRFGVWLTVSMLVVYYGFILLVAFDKQLLATRIGEGVTTLGIPIGLFVIVFTIVITAIYVRRANTEFDQLSEEINKAVLK
jgi:uncharacterized membrane protein (DUF485 family)